MPHILQLLNARLPGESGLFQLQIQAGVIAEILPMDAVERGTEDKARSPHAEITVLDVQEDWVYLGGVDAQINGALGLAFPDLTVDTQDKLVNICQFLWEQGVDGFLPTLVTTDVDSIHRALAAIAQVRASLPTEQTAQILGVHLEGPFLNPKKRGAHPQEHLRPLTLEQVKQVLGDYTEQVRVMTLAPELDETQTVIPALTEQGVIVSLGHSLATAEEAQQAFQQGASMITHACNAMPGLHHREPGMLGAALTTSGVHCGLIADGKHVVPMMVDLLVRTCRGRLEPHDYPSGLFLVSDALSPLGLPDGTYPWDTRQIQVKDGIAQLPDGTLAGTTLPLLAGVQNLVNWGICTVGEAIALATEAPRQAIGLPGLAIGQPAHLLRWHQDRQTGTLTWKRI
jgi:N-acetylglucosamine-6-phosphate deacetylase